jgi:type 1 glutamine amidotransferase
LATPVNVLLATKGHPFIREAFFSMFDSFLKDGITWTHVEQPAAQLFYQPTNAAPYDVIVDYSMPGVGFGRKAGDPAPPVPEELKKGMVELMNEGTHGFVFIHHNICSWPGWEEYAEIVGGRFLYYPGKLRGQDWPDSGYLLGARSTYIVTNPDHPVTEGLPPTFDLQDELYLAPYFESDVVPLIRSDFEFVEENFFSPYEVVGNGRMYSRRGWHHPPTSNMVCWAKHYGNSPIVYIQAGDVPTSYNNPSYRRLLTNAIKWVASDEAKEWARARARGENVDPVETVKVTPRKMTWPYGRPNPQRNAVTPDRTCLFCDQDGVERYGGVMDQHTVVRDGEEVRGPLCGNCHVLLLNEKIDTGGWRIKAD